MISDQNAKGRFDKFVLKMRISKMHYKHSFAWKMFTHRMPTHPIVSRPKRKTLMGKYLFIYSFKTLVGKGFIESLIWSQTSLFGHDDDDGKNENVDDVLKKIQSPINKPIVWCTFRLLVFQLWFFFRGRVL